jgi:hypothetical protein
MSADGTTGDRCRFKDLCVDVTDQPRMATFWASALGLEVEVLDNGAHRLGDDVAEHTLWVNRVPEPRTVKQRVHLDVVVREVADLLEGGASLVRELPRWTLLSDPEGGELCAFVRSPERLAPYRLLEIVVDAVDPGRIAAWWADRLGTAPRRGDDGSFWWLEPIAGLPVEWVFQAVPEPKRVKNRIHWDVLGDTAGLITAGAVLLRTRGDDLAWDVLADPEGNEFCVFPPR